MPLRFQQRDVQHAMRHQEDEQGNEERGRESREPGQARELLFFRLSGPHGGMRFLSGLVDDVAAIQEDRRFEEPVGDEMEDGQREGAQSTFHDHVAHLADRGETRASS